jgi:hypothetical protein
VRRLLPLVAMGVGVGLQPGSLVIFSGAAALDPHSAIIFLGLLSVSAMTVSRWPYLFLIAIAVALVGISATVQPVPHHISRGDFVAIHPSLQKVDRSKLFEVFRLMVSYSMDRKLHRQEEFCRAMLLRCNASCVPQRCGLTISLFEDENAQEFNVVTEQSKILGFFDILEQLPTLYTKPWRTTTNRACATTGGACTVQNSAATVASQEGYIRLIRRRFHCRVPHKHTVPIKDSYGTAWMF